MNSVLSRSAFVVAALAGTISAHADVGGVCVLYHLDVTRQMNTGTISSCTGAAAAITVSGSMRPDYGPCMAVSYGTIWPLQAIGTLESHASSHTGQPSVCPNGTDSGALAMVSVSCDPLALFSLTMVGQSDVFVGGMDAGVSSVSFAHQGSVTGPAMVTTRVRFFSSGGAMDCSPGNVYDHPCNPVTDGGGSGSGPGGATPSGSTPTSGAPGLQLANGPMILYYRAPVETGVAAPSSSLRWGVVVGTPNSSGVSLTRLGVFADSSFVVGSDGNIVDSYVLIDQEVTGSTISTTSGGVAWMRHGFGDVNSSGSRTGADREPFLSYMGSSGGDATYRPDLDLNVDGVINSQDWIAFNALPGVMTCFADIAGLGGTSGPDGQLTADDMSYYLAKFFANSLIADVTGLGGSGGPDGQVTVDDLIAYQSAFYAGCP